MSKRNNLVNDKKFHNTYRITNIKERMYYYGVHSCDCLPEEEIGLTYFSSSKNKEFIKDQKENPQNYKYKIIKIFQKANGGQRVKKYIVFEVLFIFCAVLFILFILIN